MLVYFSKRFTLEGETAFKHKIKLFSKPELVRQKIYLYAYISGVCDETELEAEVERLTNKQLESPGWGEDFIGWQRVLPYEESLKLAEQKLWDRQDVPDNKLIVTSLDDWTVEKAAKSLTGKQFAQYCRDYGIVLKGVD